MITEQDIQAAEMSLGNTVKSNDDVMVVAPEEPQNVLRPTGDRPVHKLSVKLIDTYKNINKVYYEAKAKRLREQADVARGGVNNDGYDDANYDYILSGDGEVFADRYILKHRIGKGSFGQVVCAYDKEACCEVAIKIIKSRKPFLVQAQTEIHLLTAMLEKDLFEENNVVKLIHKFMYRNHQCLVFEMLSYNLYELLKNTRFKGISVNLTRKFGAQLLRTLEFLASPEVDIIHCDLKPENILLRHPRRSAIKVIDFGSSCLRTKRTYTYIQSRFYRSPEILLGLPYDQKIDMWSLGCVLVEMHTGEPLFGGSTQADQICRLIDVLGMPPVSMLEASPPHVICQFFDTIVPGSGQTPAQDCDLSCQVTSPNGTTYILKRLPKADRPPPRTLTDILGVYTGGPHGRRLGEAGHSPEKYLEFLDFIQKVLVYNPEERYSATQGLAHPFIVQPEFEQAQSSQQQQAGAGQSQSSSASSQSQTASMDVDKNDTAVVTETGTTNAASSTSRKAARKDEKGGAGGGGGAGSSGGGDHGNDSGSTSGHAEDTSAGEDSLQSSERGRNAGAQHRVRSKSAPSAVNAHYRQNRAVRRQLSDGAVDPADSAQQLNRQRHHDNEASATDGSAMVLDK